MIASWSLKFLGQTLFSAILPLVSSQVTNSKSGHPFQQLPKEFPQLPFNKFNSIQRYFIDPRGEIRIPVQPIKTYIMTQDKGGTGHRGFAVHSQALPLLDEKRGHIR
ncbi:hypothetical protein XENOCAPTIV_004345 [Xenoophorus captivus]|uniref:Uncharacterized protein n=1 Tax=Xenoophorus captivus TaxID=1517983 RepID=A0ABV0QYG0_9TELE